jgi:hypothetical protein
LAGLCHGQAQDLKIEVAADVVLSSTQELYIIYVKRYRSVCAFFLICDVAEVVVMHKPVCPNFATHILKEKKYPHVFSPTYLTHV